MLCVMVGADLEQRARTAYVQRDFRAAIDLWEQAYGAYRSEADHLGAVRMARTLAGMYGTIVGDAAVMNGWMARARRLVEEGVDSAERGWVALNRAMFEPDRARKEALCAEAVEVGRRLADADLEFTALAYLGASLVHGDRVAEGMLLLDEALAAAAGGEVDDVSALEEIFCQLFSACEHAHDVPRADAWIRVGETVAERHGLPAVSAFCHTHYGAVLTAAGRWAEADAALTQAVTLWEVGSRSGMRRGALIRLADLRVRQGRVDEAERLLDDAAAHAYSDCAYPLAAIHLARGRIDLALETVERGLDLMPPGSAAGAPLLALLVDVQLAAGRADAATAAQEQLTALAAEHPSAYLAATAALARGRVALAAGRTDARECLRAAAAGFAAADLPLELARTRLELATALAEERPEAAVAEARAALEAFERLQAARYVDAAAALLRTLGVRPSTAMRADGLLTAREAEVLDLLARGLSNPEISDRLFISRKTVEHHVGNILAKLGLRTRAEAAAYVVRAQG
jgi:DNA-binding NarL/FixJ family response regulator